MPYPGDNSLQDDIKSRIVTTFSQALELTENGSRKEALLGCDFVLRLDPLFEPARTLHRRLRDTEDEVEVSDLRAALGIEAETQAEPEAEAQVEPDSTEALEADEAEDFQDPAWEADPTVPLTAGSGAETIGGFQELEEAEGELPEYEVPGDLMTTFTNEEVEVPDAQIETTNELETPSFESPSYAAPGFASDEDQVDDGSTIASKAEDLFGADAPDAFGPDDSSPIGSAPQLDDESRRRIEELLGEGQSAFDKGEFQSAIDAWSRVFLIDIDHAEANDRIEEARRMAAESERQVEEVFHEAMSHLDTGDLELSREALERVLELQPGHLAAQEYIDRIDAGEVLSPESAGSSVPDMEPTTPAGFDLDEPLEPDDVFTSPDIVPAAPALDTPEAEEPRAPAKKQRPRQTFILVGSLVLVLVLVGGWFLIDSWDSLFPNSESAQASGAPQRIDPIARAQKLHEQGKTAIAIAQLRRLPPGDPHYAEAQALVAQWETPESDEVVEGPDIEEKARYDSLVARATAAHGQGEFLLASSLLGRAAAIAPLEAEVLNIEAEVARALEPLEEQIAVFRSGDWEYALPALWRMREADITNADVNRLIIDSYYNLGVRDLQRGRPEAALGKFEEALNLRPGDPTLQRLYSFAQAYESRNEDLLYRIFVKYLPFR